MGKHIRTGASSFSRRTILRSVPGLTLVSAAGCLGGDEDDATAGGADDHDLPDEFIFAAAARDDPGDVDRDWEPLSDAIADSTGVPTRVDAVTSDSAAVAALAAGQAHAAYLSGGPSWVGWQEFGLEVLVVEVDSDGHTHYTAGAWVRADSDIESLEDLEGVRSCHTGDLTGAGMLIPMATLAREGLVSFDDDDDITAIRDAVDEFFDDPLIGGGYIGALQCLSRGQGDVAFVRTSTPEDFCGHEDAPDWCLNLNEYVPLMEFADVPSHAIMASPRASEHEKDVLRDALVSLADEPAGEGILDELFGHQFRPATTEEHLGPYGELLAELPGIEDHLLE